MTQGENTEQLLTLKEAFPIARKIMPSLTEAALRRQAEKRKLPFGKHIVSGRLVIRKSDLIKSMHGISYTRM